MEDFKAARKHAEKAKEKKAKEAVQHLEFEGVRELRVLVAHVPGDMEELQKISNALTQQDTIIFLVGENGSVFASAGEIAARDYHVGKILKELFAETGGKGGGTPVLGQGVLPREKIMEAVKWLKERIK